MTFTRTGGQCLSVLAALVATPLVAQTVPAEKAGTLEEIIVTAQKRDEKISETPVSITALSQKDLDAMAATQFRDFATTVPGLSYISTGLGQTQVNLRGVTSGSDISPTVGIYVDEVPFGSSTGFAGASQLALDVGLFDVQRVEILRGPQGTLYGASTMGGLLKYVPVKPDAAAFGGTARAGVSSTEDGGTNYDVSSAVNLPLAREAALRLGGFYLHDAGYVDNLQLGQDDVNEADMYGGRADFLWDASERLSVRLGLYGQNISRDGSIQADYDLDTREPIDDELDQRVALREPFDQHFRLASATVNYRFDFAELTSVTSYQTTKSTTFLDGTDLYVPLLQIVAGIDFLSAIGVDYTFETDKFVQELRLASTGEHVDWLVGAFYTTEDSKNTQLVPAYDLDGNPVPIDFGTIRLPSTYDEIAGFTTLTWHATSKLDLTGGLRFSHNSQEHEQMGSGVLGSSAPKRESSESPVTYLANLRYLANDQLMTYLRVASGYRPGGPNVILNDDSGQPLAPPTFDSDSLTSYEGGIKLSNGDGRFTVDAAIYQVDWDDIQILVARNGRGVIGNSGSARSRGAELALTGRPVDALTLVGAFGYTDAQLTEDSPPVTDLGAEKGDPLPNTPKYTAALAADYSFDVGGHGAGAGVTWRYIDDRVSGYDQNSYPNFALDSYDTVDLRGHVDFGKVSVQLYVKNLGDERGQVAASTVMASLPIPSLRGPVNVSMLQPRTYGVSVSVGF